MVAEEKHHGHLRRTYGITFNQYNEILFKQGGCCGVCGSSPGIRKLAVDHNHTTGEIRGLLCFRCNKFIIGRHKDPDVLERAVNYLRNGHTGWFVPKKKRTRKKK